MTEISLIAFDADDTLWGSQTYYDTVEKVYCEILAPYASADKVSHALRTTEKANIPLLGYGSKAFLLSRKDNGQGDRTDHRIGQGTVTAAGTSVRRGEGYAGEAEGNRQIPHGSVYKR